MNTIHTIPSIGRRAVTFISTAVNRNPLILRHRTRAAIAMIGLSLLAPLPLFAHMYHVHLIKSSPAADEQVKGSPKKIHLWFSSEPVLERTRITLISAKGDTVPLGTATRDSSEIKAAISRTLASGAYRVLWSTAASDGHPSQGEFTFTVVASSKKATKHTKP